jgi:hypothetical protein
MKGNMYLFNCDHCGVECEHVYRYISTMPERQHCDLCQAKASRTYQANILCEANAYDPYYQEMLKEINA